jgi:hypothetical protein
MPPFNNPHQEDKSLPYDHGLGRHLSHTYGTYFGSQLTHYLQAYLDIETAKNPVSYRCQV